MPPDPSEFNSCGPDPAAPWPSFLAWIGSDKYLQEGGDEIRKREGSAGASVPCQVAMVRQDGCFNDPATPDVNLQCVVETEPRFKCRCDFGAGSFDYDGLGGVYVAPHGHLNIYDGGGSVELLCVSFPFDALAGMVERTGATAPDSLGRLHAEVLRDPVVERSMRRLWGVVGETGPAAALEVDGLATLLMSRLLRRSEQGPTHAPRRARLGPRSLRRVMDRIRGHVEAGGTPTVLELADAAGYSEFHFSRLFKDATGETPHACMMRLRVERADRLIRASRGDETKTLAGIAIACGFSDQSHMTRRYRAAFGVTPAVARDSR